MSIAVLPGCAPSFGRQESLISGREQSVEQQELRDKHDDLDGEHITDLNKQPCEEEEVCDCCLIGKHWSTLCPYSRLAPLGAKIGPGWMLVCRVCAGEEFYDDELQTCKACRSVYKIAVDKYCYCCADYGHQEEDCEYRHLVDWTDPSKLMSPPYADPDEMEKEYRKKYKFPIELEDKELKAAHKTYYLDLNGEQISTDLKQSCEELEKERKKKSKFPLEDGAQGKLTVYYRKKRKGCHSRESSTSPL